MNLRIAELDFDTIKTNLKTFLQSQSEFTDYDFEGSSLSVLIDLLSYNTHYNAYLANMLMNEMFLDSAVKRASAVSIAKHLGYTPRSVRSATANIDVTVTNPTGLPPSLTMDRYTPFTSTINGATFTFLTNVTKTANRAGSNYYFTDVEVKEGSLQTYSFVVGNTSTDIKYEIPSAGVDTSTLLVSVQNSATDTTTTTFTLATDLSHLTDQSTVYFLEQSPMGKYQIYFGDNVVSKSLSTGNIINVRYIVASGTGANTSNKVSQSFAAAGTIGGSNTIAVSVNSNSTGAADEETITEIKFNAPRFNAAKNRAVTTADYESLLISQVTEAESIVVWGGEDNDPPIYGKVLVSLKPFDGYVISESLKEYIRNVIVKERKVLAIQIDFIDPTYFFVSLNVGIDYNPSNTNLSSDELKSDINDTVSNYFSSNLQKFNKNFIKSSLITDVLDTNPSISSVNVIAKLTRVIDPNLNEVNVFTSANSIKFRNAIQPGTLSSSYFFVSVGGVEVLAKIMDIPNDAVPNLNGNGVLRVVNFASNETLINSIGTVDYKTGVVEIASISPTGYPTGATDIRILVGIQESIQKLNIARGELFVLDTSTEDATTGAINGVEITTTAVV